MITAGTVDPALPMRVVSPPFISAAQSYAPEVARVLIAAGAVVDVVNVYGNTPLGMTVYFSQRRGEVIELLLAAGADLDRENRAGVSPRALAERIANYDVPRFFSTG